MIGVGFILAVNSHLIDLSSINLSQIPFLSQIIQKLVPTKPTTSQLIDYALKEINIERMKHEVGNVTLSPINCAQLHAEDMLSNRYLSHWGTDGSKPYMRYTIAGGKGFVEENAAYLQSTGIIDPYDTIHLLNWRMIYDDASSNWGHRDNLLDPMHNRVSLGIAFDDNSLYIVQDFEDYYYNSSQIVQSGSKIQLDYSSTNKYWSATFIGVFFDPIPQQLTSDDLRKAPYNSSYNQGEYVGSVLPKGWIKGNGITISADKWSEIDGDFSASFDLSSAFKAKGVGVYTLYIGDSSGYYTSYSIWVYENDIK